MFSVATGNSYANNKNRYIEWFEHRGLKKSRRNAFGPPKTIDTEP